MKKLTTKGLDILNQRRIASVATIGPYGVPHLTAVWFLYEDDVFYLAIPSTNVKNRNLIQNNKVALMIDTRKTYSESGISIQGTAKIIEGDDARKIAQNISLTMLSLINPWVRYSQVLTISPFVSSRLDIFHGIWLE